MPAADIVTVSDSVTRTVETREPNKIRIISETTTISESIQLYKNGILVEPIPTEIPTPQNIIGTRERVVRAAKRPPRTILIEATLTNTITSSLKILAFSDSINKAIVGIRPVLTKNVALSATRVSLVDESKIVVQSSIKIQPQHMQVKAKLALLSSPRMRATSRLKIRPDTQSIHALKAVNFDKMYKLTRIMKIAMLAQSL